MLVLCLGIALPAGALADPAPASAYLLRLERMHALENTCVLVRGDGQYHYERSSRDQAIVFEGRITESDLRELRRWVGEDELATLTQDEIVEPVFIGPKDEVLLSVNRLDRWQNLSFPAAPTWQHYSRSVVPLTQWLDHLKKAKRRTRLREEQGREYCTPPHEPELTVRPHRAEVPFVFVTRTTSFKGKNGEEQCAVVYPDGRYHRETKLQSSGNSQIATAVYEGSVQPGPMQSLHDILARPEIQNRAETSLAPRRLAQADGEVTALTLAPQGKTRTLWFWKYQPTFDVRGALHVAESGATALEPLRQWLKLNLDDSSVAPLARVNLSNCVPSPLP